jgi:cytochrome c
MKRRYAVQAAIVIAAGLATAAFAAGERATAKEAEAMVKKGVAYIKSNPRDKAMAEISSKQGQFVDRDLYLTVYKLDGLNLAHGANEKFIGKNMIDLKDIDGKEYMRERLETAKGKSGFWQDFKFVNPVNKKIEPKQMYCERADELVVCGGIYKPV